jgi:hypothetical protein
MISGIGISGEVETDQLAKARDIFSKTYEQHRSFPDLIIFNDMRLKMAENAKDNVQSISGSTYSMLALALNGHDVTVTPNINKKVGAILAKDIAARMKNIYPVAENPIVVATGPDPKALPGARLITSIEQVSGAHDV